MTARKENQASNWTILIRLLVGLAVFIPEGIQKLMFPELLGAGQFSAIGVPWPELMGSVVGGFEIVCGILVVIGLATRFAAMPLFILMVVSIISTKIPIFLGDDFWLFHAPHMARYGFWSMAHEARNDFCMLLGALYLIINGAGRWSIDALLEQRKSVSR